MERSSRVVISIVLLAELILTLFSLETSRIPRGHDGFILFSLQYYFLNGIFCGGDIPQWIPYMTHGTVTTWWYAISATPFQSILYIWGKLAALPHNFIALHHIATFAQVLILTIGIERLARRYTATLGGRLFVVAAVLGSAIGYDQPWFGLNFFYAIPLVLVLLHLAWEQGKWRYLFLAGNLLALQHLGNLPYFIPVSTFAVAVYAGSFCALNFNQVHPGFRTTLLSRYSVAALLGLVASFGLVYFLSVFATEEIPNHNVLRNLDGTVELSVFLSYGGYLKLATPLEMIFGISPVEDFTFYLGFLSVAGLGGYLVFGLNRSNVHIALTASIITLLMMSTWLSIAAYYFWPMMNFFRHLPLIISFLKPFLCLLAGIGVEAAWRSLKSRFTRAHSFALVLVLSMSALLAIVLLRMTFDIPWAIQVVSIMKLDGLPHFDIYRVEGSTFPALMVEETLAPLLIRMLLVVGGVMAITTLLLIASLKRSARLLSICAIAFVSLHVIDIYSYKVSQLLLRTVSVPVESRDLFNFRPFPYRERRVEDFWNENERAAALEKVVPFIAVRHWTLNSFTFTDAVTSPFRTDHWLRSTDEVIRAFRGILLDSAPGGGGFEFPIKRKAVRSVTGLDEDKIQFYRGVIWERDATETAKIITSAGYYGQIPVLEPRAGEPLKSQPAQEMPSSQVHLPYTVGRFLPDSLELTVENPQSSRIWLYRSEAFHPLWRADVNGVSVPIFRANLGYQAIAIEPGLSQIRFRFGSTWVSNLQYFVGVWAAVWLVGVCILPLRRS